MKTVEFETYPDMFLADGETENPDYDYTLRYFEIPYDYAASFVSNEWDITYNEFLETYTWDDTYVLYCAADADKVIIKESIE